MILRMVSINMSDTPTNGKSLLDFKPEKSWTHPKSCAEIVLLLEEWVNKYWTFDHLHDEAPKLYQRSEPLAFKQKKIYVFLFKISNSYYSITMSF